jgi:mono/diheme cytochrome c family protein
MRLVILLFISNVLFQANEWIVPVEKRTIQNPLLNDEKAVDKGEKIYGKICWSCHGIKGEGDGPVGASFNKKPMSFINKSFQKQTDGEIVWKISTGRGNMPSYNELLSENQRWQLVSYLRTFNK